jgi:hypothetical protein
MMAVHDRLPLTAKLNGESCLCSTLTHSQQNLVRQQLDRIVASSLFRNSKRFPEFLRYTVSKALAPNGESLKERTIGVEVFRRDPDYDTALDPVVRVTGVEVRKRLRQYYEEVGHERELRIEFARGSYIPEIKFPAEPVLERARPALVPVQPVETVLATRRAINPWFLVGALATPYLLLLCFFLLGTTRQTALDRFLVPIAQSKNPVLLCVPSQSVDPGAPPRPPQQGLPAAPTSAMPGMDRVSFSDSIALSTLTSVLGAKNLDFHIRHTEDASLQDLTDGPVVLIGGYTNRWTMQLEKGLRFNLALDGQLHYIADSENPSSRKWAAVDSPSPQAPFFDFALISRVLDPTTGRTLITIAGIRHFGTESASQCFVDSTCFAAAEKLAPGDWKHSNIQVVVKTQVIGQHGGQPQVVAAYLW